MPPSFFTFGNYKRMLSRGEGSHPIICGGIFLKWRALGAAFLCSPNQTPVLHRPAQISPLPPGLAGEQPRQCCAVPVSSPAACGITYSHLLTHTSVSCFTLCTSPPPIINALRWQYFQALYLPNCPEHSLHPKNLFW